MQDIEEIIGDSKFLFSPSKQFHRHYLDDKEVLKVKREDYAPGENHENDSYIKTNRESLITLRLKNLN